MAGYKLLRSLAEFSANNPWEANVLSTFALEEYLVDLPNGMYPGKSRVPGIRCKQSGIERLLPDSLAELWRTGKAAPETLPQLLAAIEPGIALDDYKPVLHLNWMLEVLLPAALMGVAVFGLLAGSMHCGKDKMLCWSLVGGCAVALGIGVVLAAVLRVRQSRRRQQMVWLLEFARGKSDALSGMKRATRHFWWSLTGILITFVLLVFAAIFAGATLFDRVCPR